MVAKATVESSRSFFSRHMTSETDSELLLNVFADEIHRANQRCLFTNGCDPSSQSQRIEFLFEAFYYVTLLVKGAYSAIALVNGVGLVAFRDPSAIRPLILGRRAGGGAGGSDWAISSEDVSFSPIGFER